MSRVSDWKLIDFYDYALQDEYNASDFGASVVIGDDVKIEQCVILEGSIINDGVSLKKTILSILNPLKALLLLSLE